MISGTWMFVGAVIVADWLVGSCAWRFLFAC